MNTFRTLSRTSSPPLYVFSISFFIWSSHRLCQKFSLYFHLSRSLGIKKPMRPMNYFPGFRSVQYSTLHQYCGSKPARYRPLLCFVLAIFSQALMRRESCYLNQDSSIHNNIDLTFLLNTYISPMFCTSMISALIGKLGKSTQEGLLSNG